MCKIQIWCNRAGQSGALAHSHCCWPSPRIPWAGNSCRGTDSGPPQPLVGAAVGPPPPSDCPWVRLLVTLLSHWSLLQWASPPDDQLSVSTCKGLIQPMGSRVVVVGWGGREVVDPVLLTQASSSLCLRLANRLGAVSCRAAEPLPRLPPGQAQAFRWQWPSAPSQPLCPDGSGHLPELQHAGRDLSPSRPLCPDGSAVCSVQDVTFPHPGLCALMAAPSAACRTWPPPCWLPEEPAGQLGSGRLAASAMIPG